MSNTIKISKCDNQLFLVAVNAQDSFLIAEIKSGYNQPVDISLEIEEGDYSGAFTAFGVRSPLRKNGSVSVPKGDYSLVYMGLNWGGPYNFDLNFNGETFKLENDPAKPLEGAIWNKGDLNITFTV